MTTTATTRWLTQEEQQSWRSFMHATALLDDHLDRQLQRDSGMSHAYYSVLVSLSEAPGRQLRMTDLAERMKMTRSRLSHAVARLEQAGWVRRSACSNDKRVQRAVLTDSGHEVLVAAAPGHVQAVRSAIFDHLTDDQARQLGEISRAIAAGLQAGDHDGVDLPWQR